MDLQQFGIPNNFPIKINEGDPEWELTARLVAPFPAENIEWRVARSGKTNGRPWLRILAYVTNRAIIERLNQVFGPSGWRNEFQKVGDKGWLCGVGVAKADSWVVKWDGAEETQFESFKGGLSSSMKRAAVQWGIGQYLYHLEEGFANVSQRKSVQTPVRDKKLNCYWGPPPLPDWAVPIGGPTASPRAVLIGGSGSSEPEEGEAVSPDTDQPPRKNEFDQYGPKPGEAKPPSGPTGTDEAPSGPTDPKGQHPQHPGVPQADQDGFATVKMMQYIHGMFKQKETEVYARINKSFGTVLAHAEAWIDAAREAHKGGGGPYALPVPVLTYEQAEWLIGKLQECPEK